MDLYVLRGNHPLRPNARSIDFLAVVQGGTSNYASARVLFPIAPRDSHEPLFLTPPSHIELCAVLQLPYRGTLIIGRALAPSPDIYHRFSTLYQGGAHPGIPNDLPDRPPPLSTTTLRSNSSSATEHYSVIPHPHHVDLALSISTRFGTTRTVGVFCLEVTANLLVFLLLANRSSGGPLLNAVHDSAASRA